ncbi:MAG: D-alanine--D-alanine ligase [Bacteroidales bacterium]|nr:D-alanine--D-alanine ligase [Bacteroidales bacterium]
MKNIALLAGGYSGENVISIRSAEVVEKNLDPVLFNVYKIVIAPAGADLQSVPSWIHTTADGEQIPVDKNDFSLTIDGKHIKFDAAFIIVHGTPGEDGKLQGYLDMLKIPYSTCDAVTSALTFNKGFCNKIVKNLNVVNVSDSVHIFKNKPYNISEIAESLGFPCFVKPNCGGSSIGMSKVKTIEELKPAIDRAFEEDTQVLIEKFVKGREFSCGMFRSKGEKIIFPITEIISKKEFFDYEAKYTPGVTDEITPAQVDERYSKLMQDTASILYDELNCAGIVRFDFILEDGTNDLYFLEVNTVPGQSENSIVPQQARAMGMTIQELYTQVLEEIF